MASAMPQGDDVGSVQLALSTSNGVALLTTTYRLTGPMSYSRTGTAAGNGDGTVGALIGGVPAGMGYQLSLDGTASDGTTTCTGSSAPFNVTTGSTTTVSVSLLCRGQSSAGSVAVKATSNICPVLDGTSASATSGVVGGDPVTLTVIAHDPDSGPSALAYSWTASGGTLSAATGTSVTFTCGAVGTGQVTILVSDGYPDPTCAASSVITVSCAAPAPAAAATSP